MNIRRMTEKQKQAQDKLRKLTDASRILAAYEIELRYEEERAERADRTSAKEHRKRISEIKSEMQAYKKDVEKAKKMISMCTDEIGKRILSMRYLQLMRMEEIARILAYDRTYLYRVYYAALENIQQKQQ